MIYVRFELLVYSDGRDAMFDRTTLCTHEFEVANFVSKMTSASEAILDNRGLGSETLHSVVASFVEGMSREKSHRATKTSGTHPTYSVLIEMVSSAERRRQTLWMDRLLEQRLAKEKTR